MAIKNLDERMTSALNRAKADLKLADAPAWLQEYTLSIIRQTLFTNTNREMTMDNRTFRAIGAYVYDENFDFDARLRIVVDGDFAEGEAVKYAAMIADALNQVSHKELSGS